MRKKPAPYKHPTYAEIVEIGIMLKQFCCKGEDGMAIYEPGWSDQVVAEKTSSCLASVQKMRRENYGRIKAVRTPMAPDAAPDMKRTLETLSQLTSEIQALTVRNLALESRMKALEYWLAGLLDKKRAAELISFLNKGAEAPAQQNSML